MTLTRQQKVLVTILALGVGAMLIDRLVLSSGATGPSPAAAHAVRSAATGAGDVSLIDEAQALAALIAADRNDDDVADRLAEYARQHGLDVSSMRDGFEPSPTWVAPAAAAQTGPDRPAAMPQDHERFVRSHKLVAVMGSGPGAVAVIDGRALRVGQIIDGYRLIEVRERTAIFAPAHRPGGDSGGNSGGSERVELRIPAGE